MTSVSTTPFATQACGPQRTSTRASDGHSTSRSVPVRLRWRIA